MGSQLAPLNERAVPFVAVVSIAVQLDITPNVRPRTRLQAIAARIAKQSQCDPWTAGRGHFAPLAYYLACVS